MSFIIRMTIIAQADFHQELFLSTFTEIDFSKDDRASFMLKRLVANRQVKSF